MRIVYLGLLASDRATGLRRAEEHLTALAHSVVGHGRGASTVDVISCGEAVGRRMLGTGVYRSVLPFAGTPRTPWDAASWELPERLADCDLVHIHDSFSRLGELGLLVAKQLRKPVCVTEYGVKGHWLGIELDLSRLADAIVCHSATVAEGLRSAAGEAPIELLEAGIDAAWFGVPADWPAVACATIAADNERRQIDYDALGARLHAIYHRLALGALEVAA
jgi:hypothetical protein